MIGEDVFEEDVFEEEVLGIGERVVENLLLEEEEECFEVMVVAQAVIQSLVLWRGRFLPSEIRGQRMGFCGNRTAMGIAL